jgi:hypothetical protein
VLRLRQIERNAASDPGAALSELMQLRQERGPHPLVLARIAVLEHTLGMPSAASIAREAVQLARQVGNSGAITELQLAFGPDAEQIGIEPSDWLRIAAVHLAMGREVEAIALHTRLLETGGDPLPALKQLLQIAQARGTHDRDLDGALSVYATILRLAPGHSFADFAERGRSAIERRLLRAL